MVVVRVLVVEDDRPMSDLLRRGLEEDGHSVTISYDGLDGWAIARSVSFDVVVLDVMLPGIDGFEFCRRLRGADDQTPILMLTARDQAQDIVKGLDSGADDYLTKPFAVDVLLARVRAAGRRGPAPTPVVIRVGDLELDSGSRRVLRDGRPVSLSKTEYALMELLARNAGRVVPRERIFSTVWGYDTEIEANTLDAFVRLLRNKVEPDGSKRLIQTVRGVGYRLTSESES